MLSLKDDVESMVGLAASKLEAYRDYASRFHRPGVVICGPHDESKRRMLEQREMVVASEWWTAPLD